MNKKEMTVLLGSERMKLDCLTGNISRPEIKMDASGDWKVVGAVRYNNFGCQVEFVSLKDIVNGYVKNWKYKNGSQKWHVRDNDHGTIRTWMSPSHSIF
jgi:hypothetical protein